MASLNITVDQVLEKAHDVFYGPFTWVPHATSFYENNSMVLAILVALYLPVIFGIKAIMKNRTPFDLRWALVPWNFGLAIFSALGFYYTLPEFIHNLTTRPFVDVICDPRCFDFGSARWIFFFNVSKFFEFGDTLFIVLRKKPLIFLHYYHHVMTALYCWYANQIAHNFNCTGWPFAVMNLFVHTLMYAYYGMSALGYRANWNVLLTSLQLAQMFVGVYVVSAAALECPNRDQFVFGSYFALIMYFSYAVLFAKFFFDKYCGKGAQSRRNAPANGQKPKKD